MSSLPPNAFDTLMQQLGELPLWIKQVIYTQLRMELEVTLSKATLDAFGPEHTLQLWVPELTHSGQKELQQPSGKYNPHILRFLHLTRFNKNVLSITIMNNWTLEDSAKLLAMAIKAELVHPPRSIVVASTINFITGSIRLGEYLVKIDRLTHEQLEQALFTQQAISDAMGERTGIANVLINLGYIHKEDSEAILFLKEESKRNFEWSGASADPNDALNQLKRQLQQATHRIRELENINRQLELKNQPD